MLQIYRKRKKIVFIELKDIIPIESVLVAFIRIVGGWLVSTVNEWFYNHCEHVYTKRHFFKFLITPI